MLRRLVEPTVVIPEDANWGAQILGPGSIVDVDDDLSESPLGCLEVGVQWIDVVGRETRGWISQVAIVAPVQSLRTARLLNVREDIRYTPFDLLRTRAREYQQREPKNGWTLAKWLVIFGDAQLPALQAATRELGGRLRGTETASELSRRVFRLALNEELDMSTETAVETTPAPKGKTRKASAEKAAASTKSKKAAKETVEAPARKASKASNDDGRPSASVTLGTTLVKLLKRANADENSQSIAAKMADGKTATAKQLTGLRDGINAAATVAREKEKTELATELSNANRMVRRLARLAAAE